MSKRFKDIILCTCRIIICLLKATGCHRQAFTQQTVLSPDNQVFNESKDGSHQDDDKEEAQVILKINIIDNEHLEYVIINEGSEKAYYASEFYLEMYQEGKWVDVRNDVFGHISSTDVWTLSEPSLIRVKFICSLLMSFICSVTCISSSQTL